MSRWYGEPPARATARAALVARVRQAIAEREGWDGDRTDRETALAATLPLVRALHGDEAALGRPLDEAWKGADPGLRQAIEVMR